MKDKPLLSEAEKRDFSLRLAKELNLDTSQISEYSFKLNSYISQIGQFYYKFSVTTPILYNNGLTLSQRNVLTSFLFKLCFVEFCRYFL